MYSFYNRHRLFCIALFTNADIEATFLFNIFRLYVHTKASDHNGFNINGVLPHFQPFYIYYVRSV